MITVEPNTYEQAAILIGIATFILVAAWFVVKMIVGHVVAHYAIKKAARKWGRQPEKKWTEEDDL
jgi:hypothetical protein